MAPLGKDFLKEDPWRIFRIMSEFVDGFEELSNVSRAVSIFGSAKAKPHVKSYRTAEATARLLAKRGYAVITGAGPGIMEAANKGAKLAGGESIGLNIMIPTVQRANRYVTRVLEFKYFFCRKVMFAKYSKAFIVFPGGFGTLDEFFEVVTLIQTERVEPIPVILVGRKYWAGLLAWINRTVLAHGAIDRKDLTIFTLVDTPREVADVIDSFYRAGARA
jgi:uncharacterized protein (TIGR00730 family)